MSNDQVNVPSLVLILVLSGLIVRYLFFSNAENNNTNATRSARDNGRGSSSSAAVASMRQREAAAERLQQMFPQVDRRTALWNLQRNGGNIAATTERVLAGRLDTPPITFQPPPLPGSQAARSQQGAPARPAAEQPAQPDLIERYKLQDRVVNPTASSTTPAEAEGEVEQGSSSAAAAAGGKGKSKGWSSNKEERQSLLQKRRDEMILAARRKMEAKIAAEKNAGGGGSA